MNSVKIQVGPRSYQIACDPADEEKVRKFGALIDENYAKLGNSRAAQEADNMVFAALFLADELDEARKETSGARTKLAETNVELERAKADMANAVSKAKSDLEQEIEKASKGKGELHAEIETLRKAEEHARNENAKLKAEIAAMKEEARHQHDLFGSPEDNVAHTKALAEKLEALAARAEATASELEGLS
ncbi:MAG: cell division protein ZapA [Pseudomonadota bacterium]